jgi:hypothetical protein
MTFDFSKNYALYYGKEKVFQIFIAVDLTVVFGSQSTDSVVMLEPEWNRRSA